mmetsp:Transcript_53369/g.155549  ORF Transcript_53369/g.155549 Transcript_53369/m.155549 type:complete len:565 (+) Transcript_53369:93-1787(+)
MARVTLPGVHSLNQELHCQVYRQTSRPRAAQAAQETPAARWQLPPSFLRTISQQCVTEPAVLPDGCAHGRRRVELWPRERRTLPASGLRRPQREHFELVLNWGILGALEDTHNLATDASLVGIDSLVECSSLMTSHFDALRVVHEAKTSAEAELLSGLLLDTLRKGFLPSLPEAGVAWAPDGTVQSNAGVEPRSVMCVSVRSNGGDHAVKATEKGKKDAVDAEVLLERAFGDWQFDAFALADVTANRPLSTLAEYLFTKLGFVQEFDLDTNKLSRFFTEIEIGYDESNPYHNRAHGASVLHAMHALLEHGGLMEAAAPAFEDSGGGRPGSGSLERMACLLAAAIHDYDHVGLSNEFLVKTSHERAVRYNDQHVNEQHHVAAAFAVLLRPECNFLEHLPTSSFRHLRGLAIDLVLSTDMANNNAIIESFTELLKARVEPSGSRGGQGNHVSAFVPKTAEEALLLLQVAMKCADLGHLALDWNIHVRWVGLLEEEFFRQGDREKRTGLPISFLMDREKPGASATQVGFFDFVVLPLFQVLHRAIPRVETVLSTLTANYQHWKEHRV